ncbi:similar to 2610034M16Rik protein [Rattus norvegicus]|uniref:similar to 2610034M16Rik protein n=1 Tax=Rattus norvegicus TaxID=10116 RepID=UPI001F0EEB4D|nr:similar to 2610034M16Rik protein [Rattus norvegicus]
MGTSQPSGPACPKNVKDFEEDIKGHTSEAVFHQTRALGKLKESGDDYISASINGKQNSSFLIKDEKKASSDNNIPKRMENGYPPPVVSHQLEEVLSVAMFNDREKSLPGKITTQDFSSTVEVLKPAKGKFIREVKCGTFNVQVETTENVFYKTGAQFLTKRRRPTCHQHCSIQQVWRASKSRRRFSKYRSVWAEDRVPSTQVREMSRSEVPSMNISIVGKEIVVKYVSKEQNISINVSHPKSIGKSAKRSRGSLNHTTNEPCESPSQPGINLVEKQRPGNQNQNSESLPDAPCSVNTDQKKNSDTVVASLSSPPRRETKKPSTPPSAPSDSEERDSDTSQQKVLQITQDKPLGQHCLTADTCLPPSSETLRTTSLSNGDLSKMSFEGSRDVDEERKSSSDVRENITSESQVPLCTAGTNGPLSAMGGMLPVQDASESEFCPLSCLTLLLLGEKAESIGCRGDRTLPGEGYESSNSISSVSEEATKASPLLSPSHWGTRCSKPGETPGSTFSCSQYIEFETEQEKVHYRDINKAILHGNSSANTQPLERKTPRSPAVRTASCSSLVSKSSRRGDIRSSVEWDQTEGHAHHVGRAGLSRTEVPASAFLTDELEQRLTTQNYKEGAVDSNSPVAIRNPGELTSYLENVEDDTCHATAVVENACHQDFEDLTSENQNEIGSQMKFAQNTTESACVGHTTEKLFLLDKTLTSDEDPTRNGDRDICGLSNFRQELAECQRTVSTVHPEESGNERTFTEASYHPVDIPLSPQKQKALKDQNLEINNPRKLSQELALRGGRASDGSQEEAIDQWARRRQQFKDGKRCSSAGGSSVISNFTEGSVTSDDAPSVDFGFRGVDIEEKGFYTENFHSMAWVFRGDDGNPEDSPRCLSKKPRPVAVRERTVRLFKGTGDYPWGFRIQFSKPIVVTEVDTNSAAEEAGLQIGDVVLSVNGTEVTSVEHAEAVHLAKKGPDILTMVVGSDISRCPNTPWPTCRGYLHKRTHSGFVKGWRKRWFVLKHDGFLLYYKHRKDEGKWPPVDVIKLEGAEVDIDNSLGKPFVFNCMPQSGSRTFCLCATSNQEMKRWLEAMQKAARPVRQNHVWEDVTAHNSSLPPLAIKHPECLGLLHQLERSTDVWIQHYCILKDGCLYFYASIRSTQASGGLYLQGYSVIEQTHGFEQPVIELRPSSEEFKTFYFCAENKTENQRWIAALKTSIKKWLPLDQAIQEFMNRPLEETRM